MSYNYQYQQPEQTYQHGSIYGSNTAATPGGSYQLGANSGYNAVSYGSPGGQSGGVPLGTSGQQGMQNSQYAAGYGGQQAYNPNYPSYSAGSASATTGIDPYTGLATAQATMAQATPSMASGYPGGQQLYYGSPIPSGSPPAYGSAQSSSSLYSSQSTSQDYSYGAGYPGGVRSASGGMESYSAYPTSQSTPGVHQSSYASTYPSGGNSVSSTAAAMSAVAGMPVPLGSSGGFAAPMNGATGTAPEGEQGNCLMM